MESLSTLLRQNQVETLLWNASLVRDWPDDAERRKEAQRLVRAAMYEAALGRISDEVKQEILTTLYPLCPEIFYAGGQATDEWPGILG